MLQPTGPLPPAVYWRRRAAALAALVGLVALLGLLIWLVAEVARGEQVPQQPPVQPAAQQQGTTTEPPPATTDSQASVTVSSLPPPPPDGTAAPTTQPPTTQPAPTTQPPGPPQPCPDQAIALAAQPEAAEYRVGAKPVFRLTVTNTGAVPCTRDLDAGLQELLVFAADGTTRLWSSNDCYPGDSIDIRTLQPGQNVAFTVTWAGRSSRPQCAGQRVQVPAGDYLVVGKLGPLTSPPTPFRLVR